MLEQLKAPDHVIAIRFSGKLTGGDMQQYRSILDDKLAKHAHISACIDLTRLSDLNAEALVEGAKADLELLNHLSQFSRCAFVSDKEWPQAIVHFMDPVFPTFAMRVFTHGQGREAITWAAELPKIPEVKAPAFRFLPTSRADVLAFEINGIISSEEMPGVLRQFDTFLCCHEKVRLLNRMKHFGGVDPSVFMQGGFVSIKLAAMQKVERYAIVGAPSWMNRIIGAIKPAFAGIDIETFPLDREGDAWKWIGAIESK